MLNVGDKKSMDKLNGVVKQIVEIAEQLGKTELAVNAKFLLNRINHPESYLVFLGETCCGKSTLINGILNKEIMPVSGIPSTGAITEIYCDNLEKEEGFFAINKNATMETLDQETFQKLIWNPDDELERLRYVANDIDELYQGIRIFDTPGYGSLTERHDRILMDFIDQADAIVYVVFYRKGIQKSDKEYLKEILSLKQKDIPVYLLVNRCPSGTTNTDHRVKEIYRTVIDIFQNENIPLWLIHDEKDLITAQMNKFSQSVTQDLNTEERKQRLKTLFIENIRQMILQLTAEVENMIYCAEASEKEKAERKRSLDELKSKFKKAETNIVIPGFEEIQEKFVVEVEKSQEHLKESIYETIDEQAISSRKETNAYIQDHVLNQCVSTEVKSLYSFLEKKLMDLDEAVSNYLNTAIISFEKDIELQTLSETFKAGSKFTKNIIDKLLTDGLLSSLARYGGRGGKMAGVANGASHLLKKVGNIFGKTFSRETHNSLKHILKVLGFTSEKVFTTYVAVGTELVGMAIELNTWKPMLKRNVKKSTDKWADSIKSCVSEDLDKLKDENINMMRNLEQMFVDNFSVEEVSETYDMKMLNDTMEKLNDLERMVA
jgi:GTPase Era involved in 16S rRNA processing